MSAPGWLWALALLVLAALPAPSAAETRVALVIGNGAYRNAPRLANPANDARAVADALRRLDFTVEEEEDLDIDGTWAALGRFADLLPGADVGLLFYAGHSLQVRGENYLVPVDAKLDREMDLDHQAVGLGVVLRELEARQRTSLVFLDACRDNPFARSLARGLGETRSQSVGRGLAEVESGIGTLIAFATQPGNVASDGQGDHSPFTAALLANLETPGLEVGQMLRRVRKTVIEQTAHQQVPWENSSLTGDFYFKPPQPLIAAPTPPVTARDVLVWKVIEDSTEPEVFSTFIAQYPDSPLVPFARTHLAALRGQEPPEAPSTTALTGSAPKPSGSSATESPAEPPVETAGLTEAPHPESTSGNPTVGWLEAAELALGWSQDDWRVVQRALNALGHPAGQEDGLRGRQSRSAIKAWQQASGDEPSGYLTEEQRTRLLKQAEPQLAAVAVTKLPPPLTNEPDRDTSEVGQVRKAAEEGDAAAQVALGLMYHRGHGMPRDDAQAAAWYRKAAEQGDAWGQNNLGRMYENGLGVPQDDVQAVAWYRKAAEQGNATTQTNLGRMYESGRGVPQDDAQAAAWYRKAAEQGEAQGQNNLGWMCENGLGVPQDDVQAAAWYRKAAEQGLFMAIANLMRLGQPVPTPVRRTSG